MTCYGASAESGLRPTFLFDLVNGPAGQTGLGVSVTGSRPVVDRIKEAISPILWTLGLELVDVICLGQGPRSIVRVFIDKPGGITLSDCERAHVALSPALDVADPFPHAYTLEVSSPGLDRPFKRIQDYHRAIGKRVSLKLRQPLDGQWRVVGTLTSLAEETLSVLITDASPEHTVRIGLASVAEAKLVVTW